MAKPLDSAPRQLRSASTCLAADSAAGLLPGTVRVGEGGRDVLVPQMLAGPQLGAAQVGTRSVPRFPAWGMSDTSRCLPTALRAGQRCCAPAEVSADKVTFGLPMPTRELENQSWQTLPVLPVCRDLGERLLISKPWVLLPTMPKWRPGHCAANAPAALQKQKPDGIRRLPPGPSHSVTCCCSREVPWIRD